MAQEVIRAQAGQQGWRVTGSHSGCVREGEKAMDEPMEGNRVELCNVGLSISSAKSYLWLSHGCFLLCFLPTSPVLSHSIPSHPGRVRAALHHRWVGGTLLGLTCLEMRRSDHFWQHGWEKARTTEEYSSATGGIRADFKCAFQ